MSDGALALVLHTHMPYVEGYGTWPFGEEWLWEAVATCYLPVLDVLEGPLGDRVTLSVTPVLLDQLEYPGAGERLLAFLRDMRPLTHALDAESADHPAVAAELERGAALYAAAADRFEALGGGTGLAAALVDRAAWTSSATHAILPLAATAAGVGLQLDCGIDAHRRRAGGWGGGLWLPECAHDPALDPLLAAAGVHVTCVEWTDVTTSRTPAAGTGPTLVPIDREAVDLVWGAGGYPSRGAYRDTHRRTRHHHHAWAVDGAPYDPDRAAGLARADAEAFVRFAARRGGLCTVALDTELLGLWWHEGPLWLAEVLRACERLGLPVVALDEVEPRTTVPEALGTTTWGHPRDLTTWSRGASAPLAWAARRAELDVLAHPDPGRAAVRELLALQSSDWGFLVSRGTAGPYPAGRARDHAAALRAALGDHDAPGPRGLAPWADPGSLRRPLR